MKSFGKLFTAKFGVGAILFIYSIMLMFIGGGGAPSGQKMFNWTMIIGGLAIICVTIGVVEMWKKLDSFNQ